MRHTLWLLMAITLLGCSAPTENITAIRENAYKQGYDSGLDKGYIKGTDDAGANIEDIKQNAYKEGYAVGYDNATAYIEDSMQSNSPIFVTTISTCSRTFPAKYVGNKSTKIFHFPLCVLAQQIPQKDQLWSNSAGWYSAQGMKPCDKCKPPSR